MGENVIGVNKVAGQEANAKKTNYILLSRHWHEEHIHNIKYFENMAKFRYFGVLNRYNI
jgi:hypothetical protein